MNKDNARLKACPEFYIADLSERCFIGNVKSGVLDSGQFFDKTKIIEPPTKDEPSVPNWFDVISFANGVVKSTSCTVILTKIAIRQKSKIVHIF